MTKTFNIGDIVWADATKYNFTGGFAEYYRKIGVVSFIAEDSTYVIETVDGELGRQGAELHTLFDTTDLDDLSIDYRLVLEQNQELLDSIKDTREWLERMAKLHNAMVRTIVEGERKILDTIKQEEE